MYSEWDIEESGTNVSAALIEYRENHGINGKDMTQKELANLISSTESPISENQIKKWETNRNCPNAKQIKQIAEKLGLDCNYLICGHKGPNLSIHQITGLSEDAIKTLSMFRKSPFLLVINKLLSQSLYPDISFKLVDIIETKKRMFSGMYVNDYEMMNSAVKGYQWDLMTIFAKVIDSCANHLAEIQLKKEGLHRVSEYEMRHEPLDPYSEGYDIESESEEPFDSEEE